MGKELTPALIKQLEENANLMKSKGLSDAEIQNMSNQFIEEYGVVKKKEEPKLKTTSSGSTSSNTKSSSVSQSSSVNPYYVDITDKSKSSNTVSKPTFTPIVDKPLFKKDINVKSASEEQKLISAKNKVNTKSGTQNTQPTNYNEIINAGIKGTPMDNTYMPLSKPIVEKQSQTLVKQATEQKKVQQQAKSEKHQNILAIMPELGQAKNKDEALGMMMKSDMKNHVDMWQQFDDNTLLNRSEYELNDFLVSNGFKDKIREQYLKEQAQSNPKYAYEYEYNQIGSLFKAVKQRADDYDYVLKSKFGDNYMQEARDNNPNILGDEDFNKYLSLREKENSLSTKANGLINDSRFKDVKKQQDDNLLANQKSDEIAKEDKWYKFSDEWRYLKNKAAYAAGHVVKLVAEIPSIATSENIGYDVTDKIADWGNRFSENLVNSVPVSSDLQNGFNYEVAKVDGYKVILDGDKNPIKIVDNNNFNVSQQVSDKIFNQYKDNKDNYEIHNEYSPRSLVDNGLNTMIDMGIMILGTKGAGMLGAGENTAKLVSMGIGYMQTKRDTFNDAIKKGLDPKDADILSNIVGIAAGTSSIINPMEFNIATGNGIMGLIKKEGFDAAKLALIREGKLSVKEYAKEFIKEATKNALKENIEEVGIENTVQGLSNNYFNNKISETDKIDGGLDTGLHWTDKQGIETLLVTAGTAILLTPLEINSQTKLNQQEALKTAFENPEQFEQVRKLQLQQGYITQEQYDNERKIYDDVSRVYNASKDEVSEKEQPYLLALLTKKYNLAYKIDSIKDDTVSKKYKDLLGMVNASIDKVMKGEKPDNTIVETDDKTTEQDNTQQNTTYGSATATYNSSISTKIDVEIANKINQHGLESLTNNEKDYYENDKENIDKLIAGIKVNGGNKNTTQTNTGSDNLVNTESNVQTTNDNNTSQSEQTKFDNTISETTNTQNTPLTNEDKKSIISNLDKVQIKEFMALKTNTERNQYLLNVRQNEQSNKSTSTASANTESGQDNGTTVQTASTNDTGLGAGNEQSVPTNTKEIQQNDKGLQEKIDNLKNVISELENSPNSPFHKLVNLDEQKAKLAELEKQLNSKTTISEQITETTPNVEDKKADIERRRQEELNKRVPKQELLYRDDEGREYVITYTNDGKLRLSVPVEGGTQNIGEYDASVPVENIINGAELVGEYERKNKQSFISKINAKYDAELDALKEQPIESSTKPTTTEIEAKKADIEKRRQEELDKYSHAITVKSTTYKFVNDGTGIGDTVTEVRVDTKADGSVHVITYFEGEVVNREIVRNKERIADVKSLIGAKGSISELQEDGTYGDYKIVEDTVTEETENAVPENKKVKEINAKYDAELKQLEQPIESSTKPTTTEIEAKKADIERRKQEDTSVERGVLINYESGKTKEQLLDIVDKLKSGNITYDEVVKEFFNLPTNTLEEIKKYFNDGTLSDKIQFGLDVKEISDSTPKKKNKEEILKQKQIALSEKQKAEDALKNSEFKIVKKKDTITGQITETKIKRNVEEKTKYEDFYKQQINVANEQIKKADAELKSLENTKEKLISIQQKPTKQVEYSVGYNPQETETTPNVEDKQQAIGGDWSKDVESTAKALEDVDNNFENINKIVDVIINTASKEEKERIKKISDRKIPKGDKHWNEKNFKSYEEAKAFADNKEKEGATIFSLTAKEQPFLTKEEMDRKGYTVEYHYNPFIEKAISEAYHKAKADGSNPELVAAVEGLLGKPTEQPKPTNKVKGVSPNSNEDNSALEGKIETLNPTGSIFSDYTAEQRDKLPLGENITTYDKTAQVNPDEKVIVYRGVPNDVFEIKSGDFVTTNKQLAKDYAGTGKVISKEVSAKEILDDKTEPMGEEYILRETKKSKVEDNSALRDVESTAKALEDVDNNFENINKIVDVIINTASKEEKERIKKISDRKIPKGDKHWNEKNFKSYEEAKAFADNKEKEGATIFSLTAKEQPFLTKEEMDRKGYTVEYHYNPFIEKAISEAYHKAKADGSNPELVKAVEDLLAPKVAPTTNTEGETQTTEAQLQEFGVPEQDVKPVTNVLTAMVDGLRKAGLTAAKTVGEWVGIGKGEAKPYTLKINGEEKTVKPVNAEVVNGFYSPLEKTINETKFDKLPAKQWIDKFAKGEEAKWTGLSDWLAQQQGSVSKADIQKYLKDNRIQVVEVVKGEQGRWDGDNLINANGEQVATLIDNGDGTWSFTSNFSEGEDYFESRDRAKLAAEQQTVEDIYGDSNTKFSQYQLAGYKEGYKEVLVTMPNNSKYQNELNRLSKKYNAEPNYKSLRESEATDSELEFLRGLKTEDFKSSHFDEPNILVHLRMNTRTDAEGNKVLFLEEVQSDWGQKGKKEGFLLTEKEAGKAWEEADKKYADFMNRMEKKYGSEWESELTKDEVNEEGKLLDARENTKGGNVPQSPFVTDTNAWTKLGLKVALKEAVAQGIDKIAWTTGEQQNDRYDLSKQVDEIGWQKNENGTYNITPKKDGSVIGTREMMANLTIKQIEDYVGKDIAEKIQNEEGKVWDGGSVKQGKLTGQQLKVGGKGMKGFYGEPSEGKEGIVGGVAKALVKELTGKPAEIVETKVKLADKLASGYDVTIKDENGRVTTHNFDTKSQGLAWLSKQKNIEVISEKAEGIETSTQHSIEITPELKAAVEKGQPLFKEAEAQYRIESGKNIIEAIKDFDGSPRATVALTHEIMHPTVVSIIDGAKEGNEVGAKHTKTIVDEYNKATGKNITQEQLIEGNDKFKEGTTTKEYRAVQEFIAKAWERYHREGGKGFSEGFQKVLDQITKAFQSVYKSLTGEQLTPELRKMFDDILGKEELSTDETTPTKEVSTSENKIKSWIDKWEELKKENDNEQLDLFYNKVKVALNGYAQGKGVVDEFTKLKSEIEQFAKERKAKPKEQGISLKDAIIDFGNGNTVSFDELNNNSENETEQIKSKAIADGNNDIRFQAEEPTDKGILDDLKTLKDKDLSDTEIRDVLDFMGYSKQDIDIALGGKEVFGIKKALVPEQVVENVNIDKLTHKEIFNIGKNNVDNNAIDPKQIVDDVLDGNITVLDANQVGSLIYYRAQLANRITELSNKIKEAEPNTGEYNVLKKQYDLALQEQDNYHEMAVRTAYNQSIAFSMRKLLIDDEYTAQKQISIYKQVNNGTISPEKEQEFKELAQKYKEASDRIAELEQEKAKWNAQNEIELTIEKSKKISKQNSDRKKTGRDLVAQGLDEIAQILGGIKFASGDNMPQLTKALSKIGRGLIEIGSATVDDVFDKIKTTIKDKFGDKINLDSLKESVTNEIKSQYTKATVNKKGELSFSLGLIRSLILNGYNTVDTLTNKLKEIVKDQFPDISDRQIHDAITRYGNSENQSKDDIDKELYKLKRIMLLMSKVEDAQAGKRPLKTGVIRDEATDEERTLQKQLNELLKDIPLDDTENDKRLKTALESVKTRLRNQIKDLETQIEQGKSEAKKKGIEYDDEANGLVELRDALKKQLEDKYGKGGMSDEQRLKMSLNQVKKAIDNYEQRINNKDFTQKDKSTTPSSEELTQAKQRLNSLKAEYTRMYKETKEYEAKQLENKKKAVRKRIEELKTKIVNKDFTPTQKKASPFDDELGKLNNEKLRQMTAFQKAQELNRIENRTKLEKAKDAIIGILNIPRMLTTTIDMSAPFRQGIRLMAGHPIEFAKAFIQMHKLAFSQKAYDDFMDKFRSSDAFPIIKASGLSITDVTSIQKAREEQFWNNIISNVLENKTVNKYTFGIPKVADNYTFKASERAYSGFLDMLRINVFMSAVDVMQNNGITIENNKEAYKQLAYYVNSATGRGDMGGVGQDAQSFLNTFFFSAKFMKSLYDYTKSFARASTGIGNELPPEIRKMIVKDFISFFAVNTILVGLGQLAVRALGGDDERKLETDGRSSDFMKIVKGDTRYEFWSGFQPAVRTAIQYATGEQKSVTTGNITELGSNMFTPTRNDKIIDFFGNKLSPIASYAYKWGKGTQFGKPFDAKGEAKKLFIPMNIQNIAEEVSNNVKASKIIIDAILNNYGVSVQNFNNNDKKEVSKDDTKANKHRPNRFKRDKNTVEQK